MTYRRYRTIRGWRRLAALLSLGVATLVGVGAGTQALGGGPRRAPAPVVAPGVTVGDVDLSGLTALAARTALGHAFERPLAVRHGGRTWEFAPQTVGARPALGRTVRQALAAPADAELSLRLRLDGRRLHRWARGFARGFDRPARSSSIVLRGLRPWATKERSGRRLDLIATEMRVAAALRAGGRLPVPLAVRRLPPRVTRARIGPAIVVRRDSNRLLLYRRSAQGRMRAVRTFGVATGQPAYPTPLGDFTIGTMQRDPWWYPPDSDWAAGASPVPPGPGNPLGTRWMGLSEPLVGIHGTPDSASIGYSASHGCIRMRIPDAEWLFEHVVVGTPVFIVAR